MKIFLPALAFLAALTTGTVRAQQPAAPAATPAESVTTVQVPAMPPAGSAGMKGLPSGMPAGMKGAYESVDSTIEKIYSAERDGFHSRAYVVKWHDQEIVVPDMFAMGDKKVGDKITFMAQELEMPFMGKTIKVLQFMAMDPDALMKMQGDAPTASPSPASSPAQ